MRKLIDDFIKNHTYINYCEAVIYKDGSAEYVKPNHVETMIRSTGKSRNEICELMPVAESPLYWLIQYTGNICVWSNGYIQPEEITNEQEETLRKLIESKLVEDVSFKCL